MKHCTYTLTLSWNETKARAQHRPQWRKVVDDRCPTGGEEDKISNLNIVLQGEGCSSREIGEGETGTGEEESPGASGQTGG